METAEKQMKILLIASADCGYVGADTVGQGHMSYAANTSILKVVSPSMLPEEFYLYCFSKGIDGIVVMSSGEESPFDGAQKNLTKRLDNLTNILKEQNIDFRRVKLSAICTVCTASFLKEVNNMNEVLKEIGPVDPSKVSIGIPAALAGGGAQ